MEWHGNQLFTKKDLPGNETNFFYFITKKVLPGNKMFFHSLSQRNDLFIYSRFIEDFYYQFIIINYDIIKIQYN